MKQLESSDWNKDQVWDNIEKALKKKRRKAPIFWWGYGGMVLFVLMGIWVLVYFNSQKLPSQTLPIQYFPILSTSLEEDCEERYQESKIGLLNNTEIKGNSTSPSQNQIKRVAPSQNLTSGYQKRGDLHSANTEKLRAASIPFFALLPIEEQRLTLRSKEEQMEYSEKEPIAVIPLKNKFKSRIPRLHPFYPMLHLPNGEKFFSQKNKRTAIQFSSFVGLGKVDYEGDVNLQMGRSESESLQYGLTNDLQLWYRLSKSLHIYAGIGYQMVQNRYEYNSYEVSTREIISDSAIVYNLNRPEPIYVKGVLIETTETRRNIIHNNWLHRWSIPVGVAYQIPVGSTVLEGRLGARIQVAQTFDGVILEGNNKSHLLDNALNNETYYKENFMLGLSGAALWNVPLDAKHSLFTGIQYEMDGLLTIDRQLNRDRYQFWGIILGGRFQF